MNYNETAKKLGEKTRTNYLESLGETSAAPLSQSTTFFSRRIKSPALLITLCYRGGESAGINIYHLRANTHGRAFDSGTVKIIYRRIGRIHMVQDS